MKTASLAHTEPTACQAEMSGTPSPLSFFKSSRPGPRNKQRRFRHALACIALGIPLALLSGCSSDNKPAETAKPEVKPPDLVGARSGFQRSYVAARGWNQDAQPYRIEAVPTNEGNGHDGKWAIWRSSFASPSARSEKAFTWSGSNAEGAPSRGVNPGTEDSYSPSNSSTQVFDPQFLKIDSDQALETAKKHGGDKVLQESPDTPVIYVCDWNHNTNQLIWHVIFGPVREGAKFVVSVDASSGEFIRVEK
jgi:hypothetical protein